MRPMAIVTLALRSRPGSLAPAVKPVAIRRWILDLDSLALAAKPVATSASTLDSGLPAQVPSSDLLAEALSWVPQA